MAAEFELLRACARWAVDRRQGPVRAAARELCDWSGFAGEAFEQGLAALASNCLAECGVDLPGAVRESLRVALRVGVKRHLVLSCELSRLMVLFDAAGIRVVTLKGPALAEAIYEEPGYRYSGDLDLLVRERDFGRAAELLEAEGYEEPGDADLRRTRRAFRRWNNEALFQHANGMSVDLHWALMPPGFPLRFEMDEIWARAERTRLSPADELAFLCGHVAKHEDRMISRQLDIWLMEKVYSGLRAENVEQPGGIGWRLRLALTPTEADWTSLPGLAPVLYFPWRVVRLGVKYAGKAIGLRRFGSA